MSTSQPSIGSSEPLLAEREQRSSQIRLRIPARAEYVILGRLALAGVSRVCDLSDETMADLKLALTEACSNSVRHAYRDGREGFVEILYDLQPGRLVVEVVDDGPGFDGGREGEHDELAEGGLGLAIIRALTDELEIGGRGQGGGSRLRFVKNLP